MQSLGMLSRVALVRSDVSEERNTSTIRVTRIGELLLLVLANVVQSGPILVTLMEAIRPPKRLFLQEPHGVT
jgi:hypothetical protein